MKNIINVLVLYAINFISGFQNTVLKLLIKTVYEKNISANQRSARRSFVDCYIERFASADITAGRRNFGDAFFSNAQFTNARKYASKITLSNARSEICAEES